MSEGGEALGQRLRRLRIARGLSLDKLAQAAGVSRQTVYSIERGITRSIHAETAKLFADALGVSQMYLETGSLPNTDEDPADSLDIALRRTGALTEEDIDAVKRYVSALEARHCLERMLREREHGNSGSNGDTRAG